MESKESTIPTSRLSEDIILHGILTKLPTKSIIRFKSVSKTWLSLISQYSSLIAAKHTPAGEKPVNIIVRLYRIHQYTWNRVFFLGQTDSNLVEIDTSYIYNKNLPCRDVVIGSCNGLVCLNLVYPDETHDLVMWNPATREVNYLPTTRDKDTFTRYAFGHDPRSGVDKIVRLKKDGRSVKAHVFCQKSGGGGGGGWRNLKSSTGPPASVSQYLCRAEGGGLNIAGAIYWLFDRREILWFDLSKEEFGEFEGPHFQGTAQYELMKWEGSLGAVLVKPHGEEFQVWSKKKESSATDSGWRRIWTIQPSLGQLFLERVLSGGQIILTCHDKNDAKKGILYDLVTHEMRELEQRYLEIIGWSHISEHFHTLISPN